MNLPSSNTENGMNEVEEKDNWRPSKLIKNDSHFPIDNDFRLLARNENLDKIGNIMGSLI